MYNDDLDALAAEYVLGTLPEEERSHAETMIAVDPGFVEVVRQWERRLGELNVMVEAVEPPAEIWDKIKSGIGTVAQNEAGDLAPLGLAPGLPPIAARAGIETSAEAGAAAKFDGIEASSSGVPDASVPSSETEAPYGPGAEPEAEPGGESEAAPDSELEFESGLQSDSDAEPEIASDPEVAAPGLAEQLLPPAAMAPSQTERSADVLSLTRRVRHWRRLAVACGALAAVLAALIVVSRLKPELIPGSRLYVPQRVAQSAAAPTPAPPANQLVGVLQQDPSAPAFVLTIDPAARQMTVRTVAAKAATNHSFELWLFSKAAKPFSLGLIGDAEYTELPLAANFDATTLQAATYGVSFEPAGGSKTGVPTGPILFTGKLVELVQQAPPPKAQ